MSSTALAALMVDPNGGAPEAQLYSPARSAGHHALPQPAEPWDEEEVLRAEARTRLARWPGSPLEPTTTSRRRGSWRRGWDSFPTHPQPSTV